MIEPVPHATHAFYRSGQIQLDRLLATRGPLTEEQPALSAEALYFLEEEVHKSKPGWNIDDAKAAWRDLSELSQIAEPWRPARRVKAMVQDATSRFITYFTAGLAWGGDAPCRFDGTLSIDPSNELEERKLYGCRLLKLLIRIKVIDRPALASQQVGAARIVETLLRTTYANPQLLPPDRAEEFEEHDDALRAATDHVASLTEQDAIALYQRVTGTELGSFSDPL